MNKYISFYCSGLIVLGVWFLRRIKNPILKSDLDLAETNVETKAEPITNLDNNKVMTKAILHTNKGDITIQFFEEQAPKTVANFTKLAGGDSMTVPNFIE